MYQQKADCENVVLSAADKELLKKIEAHPHYKRWMRASTPAGHTLAGRNPKFLGLRPFCFAQKCVIIPYR